MKKWILPLVILCSALLLMGAAQETEKTIENKTLSAISLQYCITSKTFADTDSEEVDYCNTAIDKIYYKESNLRAAKDDKRPVADGGYYSYNRTFDVGVGSGTTDDKLWYITLTFNKETTPKTMFNNTASLIFASAEHGAYLGKDTGEYLQNAIELAVYLLDSDKDTAIEISESEVVFKKALNKDTILIGLDSIELYNAFYKGSIDDYIVYDLRQP